MVSFHQSEVTSLKANVANHQSVKLVTMKKLQYINSIGIVTQYTNWQKLISDLQILWSISRKIILLNFNVISITSQLINY